MHFTADDILVVRSSIWRGAEIRQPRSTDDLPTLQGPLIKRVVGILPAFGSEFDRPKRSMLDPHPPLANLVALIRAICVQPRTALRVLSCKC